MFELFPVRIARGKKELFNRVDRKEHTFYNSDKRKEGRIIIEKVFTSAEHAFWLRAQAKRKRPYWYGTYYLPCSEGLLEKKKRQYPAHYGQERMARYRQDIEDGQMCGDCVNGAIKGAVWSELGTRAAVYKSHDCPDKSADGMFDYCRKLGVEWGGMESMPDEPGIAVRMAGHVGVYVGNGEVVEWRSFRYGCVITRLEARKWLHWYRLPWSDYGEGAQTLPENPENPEKAENALLPGSRLLKKGMQGADVRALQEELTSLGYGLEKYGADGEYGAETARAVREFQKAAGVKQDGIYGPDTHRALMQVRADMEAQSGEEETDREETPEKMVLVTGGKVNLRAGAGTQYEVVTVLRRGMTLKWLATAANGWHAVQSGSMTGWISPKYTEVRAV